MERADRFPGLINCGLCYELQKDYESAMKQYEAARDLVEMSND